MLPKRKTGIVSLNLFGGNRMLGSHMILSPLLSSLYQNCQSGCGIEIFAKQERERETDIMCHVIEGKV